MLVRINYSAYPMPHLLGADVINCSRQFIHTYKVQQTQRIRSHAKTWKRENRRESADKPGSVVDNHSSGYMSPCISSNLPGNSADHALCSPIWSCSEWGLPCHKRLPVARCALTAPFHPYRLHGGRAKDLTPC
ncbi:hypothetical protein MNBD_GAMMA05-2513 [hydrothermal vent metagenome]|uniref:Uncharacterized protein n=1 Tax=hydrothermal vent metagenome TaxID=652676 RepID=A0A3B0WJI6_9ZZZZ